MYKGSHTLRGPTPRSSVRLGLFAMDCILNLIHDSFSENDAQLVRQCNELCIPTYLVRSKSDQDIRNLKDDRGLEHGEAVSKYTQDASKNALSGLSSFSPPKQRCYLVNKIDLLVCGEQLSENAIHEKELDVLGECKRCRLYGSRFRGVTSARVPTGPYTLKVFCRNQ